MSAPDRRRTLGEGDPAVLFPPVLESGGQVPLTVTGRSMEPYLREWRDTVYLAAPRPLRRGDIVFFRRPHGGWVLHRVWRLTPGGCVVCGDAQTWTEPVETEWVLAVVAAVEKKGRMIRADSFRFRAWASVWLAARPVRRWLMAAWRRTFGRRQ